jgi:hypothetical protein
MDDVTSGNGMVSPPPEGDGEYSPVGPEDMAETISSLPMPSPHDSDSDGDSDDETHRLSMGLIMDHERSISSSVASLAPHDRVEALQKNNQDLARRLMEAERTLQTRLADHEVEIEEMQGKLDEIKSELTATKREEKELRSKEVRLVIDNNFHDSYAFVAATKYSADPSVGVGTIEVTEDAG